MTDFLDSLLLEELRRLRVSPPDPAASLSRLDFLLQPHPHLLDCALDALDGGRVCRVSSPSGRALWHVCSATAGRQFAAAFPPPQRASAPSRAQQLQGIDLAASGLCSASDAGGTGNPAYTVLPEGAGFCTCADFRRRVGAEAGEGCGRFCAHLLAVALCRALQGPPLHRARTVSDEELARLLCGATCSALVA